MPLSRARHSKALSTIFLTLFISLLSACQDPVPADPLTPSQKLSDMRALISIYESNYAPLDLKMSEEEFKRMRTEFLRRAPQTATNDAFIALMQEWTAKFHDAHLSLTLTATAMGGFGQTFPGRAEVAYTGIGVRRLGEALVVTGLLPLYDPATFPVHPGDEILEINGVSFKEYIDQEVTKSKNLGNPLSNYSLLANRIFFRTSLSGNMPKPEEKNLKLKVLSGFEVKEIEIPWIRRDLADFKVVLRSAANRNREGQKKAALTRDDYIIDVQDIKRGKSFELVAVDQAGRPIALGKASPAKGKRLREEGKSLLTTFGTPVVTGFMPASAFKSLESMKAGGVPSAWEMLEAERDIPPFAMPVPNAHVFPAYIFPQHSYKLVKEGERLVRKSETKNIGYLRIHSFSPDPVSVNGEVVKFNFLQIAQQVRQTFVHFQRMGVRDVIIDTLDNPGGALVLYTALISAMSNKPIDKFPLLEFALNDNWMGDFESMALGGDEYTSNRAREILDEMREMKKQGKRYSKPYALNEFIAKEYFQANRGLSDAPDKKLNFVVLQNENNASCGDAFPFTVADAGLGTLIGTQTMGAGGNVVQYGQLHNSHAVTTMTESRFKSSVDGRYVEGNGQRPYIVVDSSIDPRNNGIIDFAIEYIVSGYDDTDTPCSDALGGGLVGPDKNGTQAALRLLKKRRSSRKN